MTRGIQPGKIIRVAHVPGSKRWARHHSKRLYKMCRFPGCPHRLHRQDSMEAGLCSVHWTWTPPGVSHVRRSRMERAEAVERLALARALSSQATAEQGEAILLRERQAAMARGKTFYGSRNGADVRVVVIQGELANGAKAQPLNARRDYNDFQDANVFDWGPGEDDRPGCNQLALAILAELSDTGNAGGFVFEFARDVVAKLDVQAFELTEQAVREWARKNAERRVQSAE